MEIKCIKSAARLLDRNCVNKGGLDLSKEVLWVSVDHRAHSTSLERSKSPLLTQSMFKSLAALLIHFISVQSDLISIVLMY